MCTPIYKQNDGSYEVLSLYSSAFTYIILNTSIHCLNYVFLMLIIGGLCNRIHVSYHLVKCVQLPRNRTTARRWRGRIHFYGSRWWHCRPLRYMFMGHGDDTVELWDICLWDTVMTLSNFEIYVYGSRWWHCRTLRYMFILTLSIYGC